MQNLKIKIGKLELKNPVISASGTFGCGKEYNEFFDVNKLGAIVTKTITPKERVGNPPPRVSETPCGMLNAIGLENKGIDNFIKDNSEFLSSLKTNVIISISAEGTKEFCAMAEKLQSQKFVAGLEINMSCPNLGYAPGKMCAQDAKSAKEVIFAIRKKTSLPLIAKLSPNVTDITEIAVSCQDGGADAIALINTFPAMGVDINTKKPLLGNITGGLSGPAIKPIALKMIWDCYNAVKIPIIGIGGIMTWQDAVEFILCGASAVQVGTSNFVNPVSCDEIITGIKNYFDKNKLKNVSELRGKLKI
ncbi:MAG TPA: dihydroorotate dehydrogenase [Elusimicrobiales bacterium]|nr:dihydroorotate dehydrogenase [Elusimicrobiales bacterium]